MVHVGVRKKPDRDTLQLYYVDPLTGRDRTRSAKTANRRQAERAAAAWEQELAKFGHLAEDPTWEAFRFSYEATAFSAMSQASRDSCLSAFSALEKLISPTAPLSSLSSLQIERAASSWRTRGLQQSTINTYLARLRVALRWAHKHGLLLRVPEFPPISKPPARGRPISLPEMRRLLRATKACRPHDWRQWARFLRALWLTGLRRGEGIKLDWDRGQVWLDLDTHKFPCIVFDEGGQKSGKVEVSPLPPDAARWFARTPRKDRHGPAIAPTGIDGRPLGEKMVEVAIREIGKESGVVVDARTKKCVSAHDLRRSFGTRWSYIVRPLTLQKLMRHATLEMTMRYYVQQDVDRVAEELWAACTDSRTNPRASDDLKQKKPAPKPRRKRA